MKDVLLTGAAGFIGRSLHMRLAAAGYNVSILETRDAFYRKARFVYPDFREVHLIGDDFPITTSGWVSYDYVIHCGAISDTRCTDYKRLHLLNVEYTERLARLNNRARFIFFSTAGVYGNSLDCHPQRSELRPQTPYALSKLTAEVSLRRIVREYDRLAIVRPFNVYGSGETTKDVDSRSLVYRMCNRNDPLHGVHSLGIAVPKYGFKAHTLSAERDYIWVEDVADSILKLIESWGSVMSTSRSNIFNIGTGVSLTVRDLADMVDVGLIETTNPHRGAYQSATRAVFDEDSPKLCNPHMLSLIIPGMIREIGGEPVNVLQRIGGEL